MTLINIVLALTSIAMLAVLAMVFFARRIRVLLRTHLYHRVFSFFAVVTVTGILLASVLSFTMKGNNSHPGLAINRHSSK